jgi:hypothetical protein
MPESVVYARLPRGGLGNKLLVWARGLIFARKHGLPLYVSGWSDIKIGPYLRRERSKRHYWGYFEDGAVPSMLRRLLFSYLYQIHHEADLECYQPTMRWETNQLFLYDTVPSWRDYFKGLRGQEEFVRSAFGSILKPRYREQLSSQNWPVIGVHIRRSDFRELAPAESLGENCNVRTPITYYLNVISELRQMAGQTLPVTVFTDGRAEDVAEILALPEVDMAAPNPDIVDLQLLSKSKCLVTSVGSTFSYWAAYLSDGPVITHPAHNLSIRARGVNENWFEGPISSNQSWNPTLASLISVIASKSK